MASNDRQELEDLRRLDELEQKAAQGTGSETAKFAQEATDYLTEVQKAAKAREKDTRSFPRVDPNQPAFNETSEMLRQNKVTSGVVPERPAAPTIEQAPAEPPTQPSIPSRSYGESLQGYLPKTFIPPQTRGPASTEALEPPFNMMVAPLAAARDKVLGGTPRELANRMFGEPSTNWKENIISGTMEGLLDLLPTLPFMFMGRGRTPSHPTKVGEVAIESPETQVPTIPPDRGLYETVPQGAAYSGRELLTPPGSRIRGGQFSTGSGESLFGPLQRVDAPTPEFMGSEPAIPAAPKTRLWQDEGLSSDTSFTPRLDEKYPTIEESTIPKSAQPTSPPIKAAGIDTGSVGPEGQWVPPKDYTEPPLPSKWKQAWNAEKERWGQELPVLKTHPDSPVISNVEATHVYVEDFMEEYVKQPWIKSLMKYGDNTKLAPLEKKWLEDFKAGRDYKANMPEDFRKMFGRMDELLAEENAINRRRGVAETPAVEGPYAPRLTDEDFKLMRSITRSQEGAKTSQGIGPFGQARTVETLDEGLRKGITYKDWRTALLLREARGAVVRATDTMMTDLEKGGVIHRTKEAAEAVSLTHKAYPAEGLPFSPKGGMWWVRSAEERQFLLQNLRQMGSGVLSDIRGWAQQFLRNPSLINPWPHIVKNMGLKQMQQAIAGGLNPAQVLKQSYAYRWGKPDMLEEFKQVMPFTESGNTVWELIEKTGPKTTIQQMSRVPGLLNSYARKKIFAEWDPAMRYGLWREYVKKGMSPQEAANHTWIDLIRYGTRADRIDSWNSVPFNFFVPWRVGTLRTMNKALQSAPIRFGLFMGAVDTIRELDYRYNGRWTHLPYDYIERPLMTLMKEGKTEALTTAMATIIAGPGGEYMFRTVQNLINEVQGKGGIGDLRTVAWGLAQVYDLWPQYHAWTKDHNPKHLTDMLGLVMMGRHATPYGAPHRFGELIPESLIRSRPEVKEGEMLRDAVKEHSEAGRTRKMLRDVEKLKEPFQPQIP